jgi:hypothetical protein
MKGFTITCAACAVALVCVAAQPAAAGDGFVPGLIGGLAAGAIVGAAVASPPPPPVYYAPAPQPVYMPSCYWTRGEPVWDSYRGRWFRPRIQVCD